MFQEMIAGYGRLALAVVLTVGIGVLAYYGLRRFFTFLAERGLMPRRLLNVLLSFTRWLVIIIVVLMVLQEFGVAVTSVWAAISTVLLAVAVGFVAVWSVLSNLLCSIILTLVEPFRLGDEIEIIEPVGGKGLRGRVRELNLLYTLIDETTDDGPAGTSVQVPNNIFFQKNIRRYPTPESASAPLHVREG